jgi:membrane protein implicated in regulation of membrane protease activity
LTEETAMFAIIAAILFAIALILALAGFALGPLDVITFISAGLLCLALHLAGIGAGTRTWRRTRV